MTLFLNRLCIHNYTTDNLEWSLFPTCLQEELTIDVFTDVTHNAQCFHSDLHISDGDGDGDGDREGVDGGGIYIP